MPRPSRAASRAWKPRSATPPCGARMPCCSSRPSSMRPPRTGDAWTRSQRVIRERLLPLASELKVVIAVEEVWNKFLLSPLEFARYVDEFDSPRLKAYFDVGNVVFYGFPQDWIRVLGRAHRQGPSEGFPARSPKWPVFVEKPWRRRHRLDGGPAGAWPTSDITGYVTTEVAAGDACVPERPGRSRRSVPGGPDTPLRNTVDKRAASALFSRAVVTGCIASCDLKEDFVRAPFPARGLFTAACLALVWSVMAAPLAAQILYGSIVGVVKDAQGAVIPGATVTIVNRDTNLTRETTSDAQGNYSFGNVLRRPLRRQGVAAGIPRRRPIERARLDRADLARRRRARTRRAHRNDHRRLVEQPAADRFGRRAHRAQVGRDRRAAAEPVPQLSGADEPGAGHHADGVRQRGNRYAGAVAGHQRQRPGRTRTTRRAPTAPRT